MTRTAGTTSVVGAVLIALASVACSDRSERQSDRNVQPAEDVASNPGAVTLDDTVAMRVGGR
jgi:hypothetical protein